MREGLDKQWFENGKLKGEVNFPNSKKNGVLTMYYENGKMRSMTTYKNDQRDEPAKILDEDDKLIGAGIIKNGVLIK
jgi:antitoxin component YwqK of YwqJK toxin-antitoxin module